MGLLVFKISVGLIRSVVGSTPIHSRLVIKDAILTYSQRLLLIFLAFLFLFAACKPQEVESPVATETPGTATPAPSKTASKTSTPTLTSTPIPTVESLLEKMGGQLAGVNLVLRHPWYGKAEERLNALVETFNNENDYGIKVSPVGGYGLETMADLIGNETLDANLVIAQTYDILSANGKNAFVDLTEFINDPELGVSDLYDESFVFNEFSPLENDYFRQAIAIAYQPALLYYNTSWAKELGFDGIPLDLEIFTTQMMAGFEANTHDNDPNNNGTGGLFLSKSVQSAQAWYAGFDGVFSPGASHLQFDEKALLDSYEWLKTAYAQDAHWVGAETIPYDYFARRMALAVEGGLDDLAYITAAINSSSNKDEWTTMPYPNLDGKGVIAMESLGIGILESDAHKQLASWIFARYLLEQDQQAALVEVHGYWPVTGAPAAIAPKYAKENPAWASAALPDAHYILAPEAENWAITRRIFQDAYLRVYGLEAQYFTNILDLLKQTLIDVQGSSDD